ncbi:hypothetical protein FIBSPDRAFT_786159 [Athelia psychrophila]|uniref:Transferase-domain-containing protein n=1 Tax=Athelia psychrophila TaxID=1759441 RepID=A0A166LTD9_9AGAM|nr:hypothetical protein FIBSPDRAFT_786159 [Fibularhizoctonia sp. CBS 109695]
MPPSALGISEISSARIFPPSHPSSPGAPSISAPPHAATVNLSILDASVGLYSATTGIWLYSFPHPPLQDRNKALTESLIAALAFYPQWAGQLHLTKYNPTGDHTTRYGRIAVTYGTRSDPGVAVHLATSPRTISSLIPDNEAKQAGHWNAQPSALEELLPGRKAGEPGRLALWNMQESDMLPCVLVQLTAFACGGVAIAIRIAHPLADANTLVRFVRNWATIHRGECLGDGDLPVFDPTLLDRHAAGDVDRQTPDENLVRQSRALPVSRFDFWELGTVIPTALKSLTAEQLDVGKGDPMPSAWDKDAPVDHYIVYFSAKEIQGMWEDAASSAVPGAWISRFDALLAHIWALLIRARQLPAGTPNAMHVTLGVRARTASPLPATFLGSPILMTRAMGAPESDIGQLAASIRTSLTQFTPEAVAAYLHDRAFDVSAQRLWSAFLGDNNSIMTSWLDCGANQVDFFGTSGELVFVDSLMSDYDGIIKFMEVADGAKRGKWYDGDVAVTLQLRRDVMGLLLEDPLLRKYRGT